MSKRQRQSEIIYRYPFILLFSNANIKIIYLKKKYLLLFLY
jgi:hypothetical protein